jgi:hypothetical protein
MNEEGRYFLVEDVSFAADSGTTPDAVATATLAMFAFTLYDPATGIDPGSNSGNFDPDTGDPLPDSDPGDALWPVVTTPQS